MTFVMMNPFFEKIKMYIKMNWEHWVLQHF